MTTHPWLAPSAADVTNVARTRATSALRGFPKILAAGLGSWAPAWRALGEALPNLLRTDAGRVLSAVSRVDVLPVLLDLPTDLVEPSKLERALVTLWLALAGHPGLIPPLMLPGPFRQRVIDPTTPRVLELGDIRGLVATARGPVVLGHDGRLSLDAFAVARLPIINGTLIVDEQLRAPASDVVERARSALALVGTSLPGRLERVMVGIGDVTLGEARVSPAVDCADLVASAHAAYVRAAAANQLVGAAHGTLVHQGQRFEAADALAAACGEVNALPWRTDRAAATITVLQNLDDVPLIGDLTAAGSELMTALRATPGASQVSQRRALLVNVDNDFVYGFHFGRSIERRCVERNLRVDRIGMDPNWRRDLSAELGEEIPAPIADGTEMLMKTQDDSSLNEALERLRERRYEVVVANVRPRLFYDMVTAGLFRAPTLLWDRHLHDGIEQEYSRRGIGAEEVRRLPIRVWSFQGPGGYDLHPGLVAAGIETGGGRPWPMDLSFFRSTAISTPNRLFAGGDSSRDWPLLMEAVRDLPIDVHLLTHHAPADMPPNVHLEGRVPLCQFRDAMAAAAVTAIPLVSGAGGSGVTVLPMAMALGVAVVVTRTSWTELYVRDGVEALLVPVGDVGAFRAALTRLYEDAGLRARLVENARRRVAELCDLEAFTREMFTTLTTA